MRIPLYISEYEEEALIEALNETDAAWRDQYDSPLDAVPDLLPGYFEDEEEEGTRRYVGYYDNRYDEEDV